MAGALCQSRSNMISGIVALERVTSCFRGCRISIIWHVFAGQSSSDRMCRGRVLTIPIGNDGRGRGSTYLNQENLQFKSSPDSRDGGLGSDHRPLIGIGGVLPLIWIVGAL
ncbi:hypothetical protein CRG98_038778 [Punica granatum]|uniref:Uncharacterized protein n=1 Tax=Punica granatum TaxID=22663 RepID=A0A2I0I9U7_PUNGR|nr:hypothetical protein CRG98_038778 [Punica granatum]